MKSYEEIKQALEQQHENTRFFTKAFLTVYTAALETIRRNAENGIDDGYYDGSIYTRHAFDGVRKTNFYRKTGGAYCAFLEIVA